MAGYDIAQAFTNLSQDLREFAVRLGGGNGFLHNVVILATFY
jgi:hypothetical protein